MSTNFICDAKSAYYSLLTTSTVEAAKLAYYSILGARGVMFTKKSAKKKKHNTNDPEINNLCDKLNNLMLLN